MSTSYRRNSAGLAEILMSQQVGDHMVTVAEAGIAYLQTIAPRRSGRYASSMEIATGADAYPSPRRVASIVAQAPYAYKVEQNHGTLGKVADFLENGPEA